MVPGFGGNRTMGGRSSACSMWPYPARLAPDTVEVTGMMHHPDLSGRAVHALYHGGKGHHLFGLAHGDHLMRLGKGLGHRAVGARERNS
jgi:hypothetical protein